MLVNVLDQMLRRAQNLKKEAQDTSKIKTTRNKVIDKQQEYWKKAHIFEDPFYIKSLQ